MALALTSTLQDVVIYLAHGGVVSREQWVDGTIYLFEVMSEKSIYSWASSCLIFLNAMVLGFRPFLRSLPRRSAVLIVLAGAIFVTGALGFEMLESRSAEVSGIYTMTYQMLVDVEETLEGVGILVPLRGRR